MNDELNNPVSDKQLKAILNRLLTSEIDLNEIIMKFNSDPYSPEHFNALRHYHEGLAMMQLIIKMISMRLSLSASQQIS